MQAWFATTLLTPIVVCGTCCQKQCLHSAHPSAQPCSLLFPFIFFSFSPLSPAPSAQNRKHGSPMKCMCSAGPPKWPPVPSLVLLGEELGVQHLHRLLANSAIDDQGDVSLGGALAHHAHVDALACEHTEHLAGRRKTREEPSRLADVLSSAPASCLIHIVTHSVEGCEGLAWQCHHHQNRYVCQPLP